MESNKTGTTKLPLTELVAGKLIPAFGESVLHVEEQYDFPVFTLTKNKICEVLAFLRDDQDLQFTFLTDLCGIHYPGSPNPLGVVYHLHSLTKNYRVRLKVFTTAEDPSVPSATALYASANWMERETYDFYGVQFTGHPNLKRILNVDTMDYFPMRKEYALEDQTREDKNDSMFGR